MIANELQQLNFPALKPAGTPEGSGLRFKAQAPPRRATWNELLREGFDPGGEHHNGNHRARRES